MIHKRRGITLVEMLVVTTVSGVIFSAATVCLHGMYRADQHARQATAHRSAVSRLALQFRTDAHAAATARLLDADGIVFVEPSNQTIEYRSQPGEIVRTVRQEERVVHRDAFRLVQRSDVAWRMQGDARPIVTIEISRPARSGEGSPDFADRIEAGVGVVVRGG
jgi:prepilin-type N-terminal cleavage/methylation domain-containing protein